MHRLTGFFTDLYCQGGKYFFSAIKEGDELKFATEDENERHLWVQVCSKHKCFQFLNELIIKCF